MKKEYVKVGDVVIERCRLCKKDFEIGNTKCFPSGYIPSLQLKGGNE